MTASKKYILDSDTECDRLERQALIYGPERVFAQMHIRPGMHVLDAGCGSGCISRCIAARFDDVQITAVDLNPDYLSFAAQKAEAEGLNNIRFVEGDLMNLPFEDRSFDAVWSQYVLFFLPDAARAVSEFARVCRPGGEVVTSTQERPLLTNHPKDPEVQAFVEKLVGLFIGDWQGYRLPEMFAGAGLEDIRIDIETDPIYTVIGAVGAAQRRNAEEVVRGGLQRLAEHFGGKDEAEAQLQRWLAYLDRPDTVTINQTWVAKGRVPAAS